MAWPILLIDRALGLLEAAVRRKGFLLEKAAYLRGEFQKIGGQDAWRTWSLVVNTALPAWGSKSSTTCRARSRRQAIAWRG